DYQQPISYKLINNETALLSIPTFRNDLMVAAGINFEQYLSSCFDSLNKAEVAHLIVDIRNNGGGYSEYGAVLAAFLSDSTFRYCKDMVLTTDILLPDFTYDIPATFIGFPSGTVYNNGSYYWTKHSVLGWRKNKSNSFKGKVYFLINGGGASTTSEFASV